MMTCQEVSALARDHVDGRLPGRARLGLRVHLAMCKHCRRYLRQLWATLRLIQAQPAPPPPAAVEDALLARFRDRHRKPDS